jgi:hypothetical protein
VHGMPRVRENANGSASGRSMLIPPSVTIKVEQSTVVHQAMLSFDSIAFQFRLLGHGLLARPPFPYSVETSEYERCIAT